MANDPKVTKTNAPDDEFQRFLADKKRVAEQERVFKPRIEKLQQKAAVANAVIASIRSQYTALTGNRKLSGIAKASTAVSAKLDAAQLVAQVETLIEKALG